MGQIEFVTLHETQRHFVREDVYALRKDRKHLWLQKLAIYVLERLGCYWIDHTISVTRVRIDGKTFAERLHKQRRELFRHFNRDAKTLLIGAEDYQELMGSPEIHQMLSFQASVGYGREIMGLEVKVIPWMRGAVIV